MDFEDGDIKSAITFVKDGALPTEIIRIMANGDIFWFGEPMTAEEAKTQIKYMIERMQGVMQTLG